MSRLHWGGSDAFTHMLVVGPTRCGKTATILKPMIYQILLQKKKGVDVGLSVIEPKGDLARLVKDMCREMELPCVYIDPESDDSRAFNVMEGYKDDVAEATVVVLQGLFGKQEAFFQTVQELSTRNITKLLKELYGDKIDIMDVLYTLRDQKLLEKHVKKLRQRDGETDLVQFFDNELLGSLADQYRKLVIGLRAQLENITSNERLKRIMTGRSDINIDEHFANGHVLAVNTALGSLRKAGDAFGQFVIMHLQNGTFRRKGTEETRVPHFLIVDEYSRYINPDVEMFLSLAAEYKVSGVFATQSLGQLELESGKISAKAMKTAILTSCRNKIAFGGLSAADAKAFSEEFGKDQIMIRQSTYKHRFFLPKLFSHSYRDTEEEEYRFPFTYLMDGMPRFHYIHKLLEEGKPQPAGEGKGSFIPSNWRELKKWETKKSQWLSALTARIGSLVALKDKSLSMEEEQEGTGQEMLKKNEKQQERFEEAEDKQDTRDFKACLHSEMHKEDPAKTGKKANEKKKEGEKQLVESNREWKQLAGTFQMKKQNEKSQQEEKAESIKHKESQHTEQQKSQNTEKEKEEPTAVNPVNQEKKSASSKPASPVLPLQPIEKEKKYNDREAWF